MSVLRNRPKGARFAFFGFGLCVFALIPNETGYQDIASLLARQPGVAERWQKRVFASAVASIQVATFSFGRPIGTSARGSATFQLASLDNQGVDITGSVTRNPLLQPPPRYQPSDFPRVNRALKGDRLADPNPEITEPANPPASNEDPSTSNASVMGAKTAAAVPLDPELAAALNAPPLPQYDVSSTVEIPPQDAKVAPGTAPMPRDAFSIQTASLFFGSSSLGVASESMERWQPGEEPTVVTSGPDPDMKAVASLPAAPDSAVRPGESTAAKGEV